MQDLTVCTMQGDVAAQRARYEARWATFISQKITSGPLAFRDIPWLADDLTDLKQVKALVLHGVSGHKDIRKRLQAELMRWHPDKFMGRWNGRLLPVDQPRVLEKVSRTSQVLTELLSSA